jgi:hypothetical protein
MNTTTTITNEEEVISQFFKDGFDVDSSDIKKAGIIFGIDTYDTAFKRMCKYAITQGVDIGEEA